MKALITKKLGMTSQITENGTLQAVTLLEVPVNRISQLKSTEKDGYRAIQLKVDAKKEIKREIRVGELPQDLKIGDKLSADLFSVRDSVKATSISKGKGFTSVIKRWNFHSQRATHGAKGATRRSGSIGSMFPQKVFKGKKMAGHKGHTKVTTKNLEVTMSDPEKGVIAVKGSIPGPKKSLVIIKETSL